MFSSRDIFYSSNVADDNHTTTGLYNPFHAVQQATA